MRWAHLRRRLLNLNPMLTPDPQALMGDGREVLLGSMYTIQAGDSLGSLAGACVGVCGLMYTCTLPHTHSLSHTHMRKHSASLCLSLSLSLLYSEELNEEKIDTFGRKSIPLRCALACVLRAPYTQTRLH